MIKNELLNYFNGDEMAAKVWQDKYAAKGELTPNDMHKRLAKEYARIEYAQPLDETKKELLSKYGNLRIRYSSTLEAMVEYIYKLFKDFKYIIPAGSVMANLGKDTPTSLSNCFVLGQPKDNIESIFNFARDSAQVFKRRGGAGIDLSNLRPQGAGVDNAANNSTGPVSFMDVYSATTSTIGQDGRRAAEMISIHINHPDSPLFVKAKEDKTKVTSANISLKINREFMQAVEKDETYILRFPCNVDLNKYSDKYDINHYDFNKLYRLDENVYIKHIKAKELWDSICQHAHDDAEPGIIFEDNHLDYDPAAVYEQYKPVTTNPCGEIFMGEKDSCRLSAINLYSFVNQPFTKDASIDFDKLYEVSYEQLVLSDDLVDLEIEAIDRILGKINGEYLTNFVQLTPYAKSLFVADQSEEFKLWWQIRENGRLGRRVGNGFTGLADMIAAMNLSLCSNGSFELIDQILHIKMQAELDATIDLAILRGPFDGWDDSKEFEKAQKMDGEVERGTNDFFEFINCRFSTETINRMRKYGRRNVSFSTVAPTGTTSLMTQTTSGIEPLFQPVYKRRVKVEGEEFDFKAEDGNRFKEYLVVHPKLKEFAEAKNFPEEVLQTEADWLDVYKQSPYYKSCANDINWKDRIDLQSLIQMYTSHSISSTLNLSKATTVKEVSDLYKYAHQCHLKGVTVYVDGSREGILVDNKPNETSQSLPEGRRAPVRPKVLPAKLTPVKSKGINYAVIVGFLNNKPYEIFAYVLNGEQPAIDGTLVKVKRGVYNFISPNYSVQNLQLANDKIEERACTLYSSMLLREGADINHVIKTAKKVNDNISSFSSAMCRVLAKYAPKEFTRDVCPDCGGPLQHEAGCVKCNSCLYSKCLTFYKLKTKNN